MTPRVKPPHTLVSVLHCLWYCRATALSALANLTLLLGKNTLPFPAFGNLNFVSPPHRRAYTSIPKSCPNIRFPHQQDFFPIRSVTKSSTARFSHENLVEKFKIFVQDFVPIRTALGGSYENKILYKNLDLTQDFPNKISVHFLWVKMLPKNLPKIFRWPEMCPLGKIALGGSYENKILYKNLDLTQDFPNKISVHFLWVKMLPKNLPKIFRWPEMCPLGKILA